MDVKGAESSAAQNDDTEGKNTPTNAESSAATGADELQDATSIIRDVVSDKATEKIVTASPAEGEKTDSAKTSDEDGPEDYSDQPWHKHPRFKKIIRQRDDLRKENGALATDATHYRTITTFLSENGLSNEEAADGLQIMAVAKRDPAKAVEMIRPWLEKVLIAAGEILPDDLAQKVQQGHLPNDAAFEVSRARAQAEALRAQQELASERQRGAEAQRARQERLDAAETWQADRVQKDPNFAAKLPLVMDHVKVLQFDEGVPSDAAGVKAQLDRAYKRASELFTPPPHVVPRRHAPPASGQVAGNAAPADFNSTLDIVRARGRLR